MGRWKFCRGVALLRRGSRRTHFPSGLILANATYKRQFNVWNLSKWISLGSYRWPSFFFHLRTRSSREISLYYCLGHSVVTYYYHYYYYRLFYQWDFIVCLGWKRYWRRWFLVEQIWNCTCVMSASIFYLWCMIIYLNCIPRILLIYIDLRSTLPRGNLIRFQEPRDDFDFVQ